MNSLTGFETFHGSLGVLIGFLLWVYFGKYILLFGVYMMEAIEFYSVGNEQAKFEQSYFL